MCGKDSNDPLVNQLFIEQGLCLLKVGRSRSELDSGSIIVTYPRYNGRPPVIYKLNQLFYPFPSLEQCVEDYGPIDISSRSKAMTAHLITTISSTLGCGLLPKELHAALAATTAKSFQVNLENARRYDLVMSSFEPSFRQSKLNAVAMDLCEQGARLYLVTRVVTARQVRLHGDTKLKLSAEGGLEALTSADFSLKYADSSTILMRRMKEAVVIGFQALEIIENDSDVYLKGLDSVLHVLGESEIQYPIEDPEVFAEDGTIFSELVLA